MDELSKDEAIRRLVARLDLPRRGWVIVDHGDGESTSGRSRGDYDYECETPDASQPLGYRSAATGQDVDFVLLLAAIERHLA